MRANRRMFSFFTVLFIVMLACSLPTSSSVQPTEEPPPPPSPTVEPVEESSGPPPIVHYQTPSIDFPLGRAGVDVESSGTGPEGRAPYGDSYDISLLERPFLQDMTYVPDLDISFFSLSQDDDFYYVSIRLVGDNPNNPMGIHYAVELDLTRDGFGDFIIWASPPYSNDWTADNVQVFADLNKDTAGRSAARSDAPFDGDGYETLIHDITQGVGDDPDLTWVRISVDGSATVEFAFKKSLAGDVFMYGVVADAGFKDVSMYDYVDRFTEVEAGSPVRNKREFPLKELHSVDNTCRQPVGFSSTGFEPKVCPPITQPAAGSEGPSDSGPVCADPMVTQANCAAQMLYYWPPPHCACSTQPYNP
jgi:hypothetical protein